MNYANRATPDVPAEQRRVVGLQNALDAVAEVAAVFNEYTQSGAVPVHRGATRARRLWSCASSSCHHRRESAGTDETDLPKTSRSWPQAFARSEKAAASKGKSSCPFGYSL